MQVTLLGTGDTTGTPTPGCDCGTCERARDLGVTRRRFSVHVRNDRTGECLLIDCSPDFRQQFLDTEVPLPDAALVTHVHFDHLDGLGNIYRLLDGLDVYAADETDPELGDSVAGHIRERYGYLDRLSVHGRKPSVGFEACGFEITLVPVDHPPLASYGIVIRDDDDTVALTGDTSYAIPQQSRRALADADLLLVDAIVHAEFCDRHPAGGRHHDETGTPRTFANKHLTREGALALIDELEPERARLVHCSHFYPPDEAFEDPLAVDGEQHEL